MRKKTGISQNPPFCKGDYSAMDTIRDLRNGWKRFDGKLWQRNYYEHIIRSMEEYERIAGYIIDNPVKWQEDEFFK